MQTLKLNRNWQLRLLAGLPVFFCITVAACHSRADATPQPDTQELTIDYRRDVLPILSQSCFRCHDQTRADGDLRLDSRLGMLRGGHTGNSILGSNAADSELIRRVRSDAPGYRMPKEGMPLSNQDIELLERWIDQGAVSSDRATPASAPAKADWAQQAATALAWTTNRLEQPRFQVIAWISGIWLAWMIVATLLGRRRRRTLKSGDDTLQLGDAFHGLTSMPALVIATVVAVLLGVIGYQRAIIAELPNRVSPTTDGAGGNRDSQNDDQPPVVYWVDREVGLAADYYRGNDERSDALYNNGVYRTADLEVAVVGGDGQRLSVGDDLPATSLAIELSIGRAHEATKELFRTDMMETAFVSSSFRASDAATGAAFAKEVEPGQRWQIRFPISDADAKSIDSVVGTCFVWFGRLDHNRIHYAIQYDIRIADGRITSGSFVRMGSVYNLAGRVIAPTGNQIPLHHWFDRQPIPEIEGKGSEDPEALGLPEHLSENPSL